MSKKRVIIIGGGVGGLCTGLRLLHAGYKVSLYEKEPTIGGVSKSLPTGYHDLLFDNFASIGIHPNEYLKIFNDINIPYQKFITPLACENLYHIFYSDDTMFSLNHNILDNKQNFEEFYNTSINEYLAFTEDCYNRYLLTDEVFLSNFFTKPSDFFTVPILKAILKLKPWVNASTYINKYIKNQKLRNLINFQSFYMGLPPKKMPNLYATVSSVTQKQGLIYIKGGIGSYIKGLEEAFICLGGKILYNHTVQEILIEQKKAFGIICNNSSIYADIIISNVDYNTTRSTLLSNKIHKNMLRTPSFYCSRMSCSVFMLRLVLNHQPSTLSVHNIYIDAEMDNELLRCYEGQLPMSPPLYIYCPAAIDDSFKDKQYSTISMMLRVPNLSFNNITWDTSTIQDMRKICLKALSKITKTPNIQESIVSEIISTPSTLQEDYGYFQGAAFGIAPTLLQSGVFRPQITDKKIQNLYYVGPSVHPGNGLSIVMKGAELLANHIIQN